MDSIHYLIRNDPQVFVDNELIECTQGLTRRWHKPVRHQEDPIVLKDQPWEETLYFTYSNYCVIKDPEDGLVKCWYEDLGSLIGMVGHHPWKTRVLYAESEDGIHFRKPELDIYSFEGNRTNVIMGYTGGADEAGMNPWSDVGVHTNGIIIDPEPPTPAERFRTIFSRMTPDSTGDTVFKTCCAHSPDGVHWTPYDWYPTLGSAGSRLSDVSCIHYDHDARHFVQNTRHGELYRVAIPDSTPQVSRRFRPYHPHRPELMAKRRVFQSRSHDFRHWSDPLVVSVPDDFFDNLDEAHYGMQQFRVGRLRFGTLGVFRYVDNEMEVRLVYSRDGVQFKPCDLGKAFIEPRGPGNWDAHMVSCTSQPVEVGDEWWFYHGGTSAHHDWWFGPKKNEPPVRFPETDVRFGLGLARIRKEGLVSLDGSLQRDGYVITHALWSLGDRLVINAECRPGGWIKSEILDCNNRIVGSCSLENSDPFEGDETSHMVSWQGKPLIPGPGEFRKIHFLVKDAEVFSFRFAEK
jgi:hypothetical protein